MVLADELLIVDNIKDRCGLAHEPFQRASRVGELWYTIAQKLAIMHDHHVPIGFSKITHNTTQAVHTAQYPVSNTLFVGSGDFPAQCNGGDTSMLHSPCSEKIACNHIVSYFDIPADWYLSKKFAT